MACAMNRAEHDAMCDGAGLVIWQQGHFQQAAQCTPKVPSVDALPWPGVLPLGTQHSLVSHSMGHHLLRGLALPTRHGSRQHFYPHTQLSHAHPQWMVEPTCTKRRRSRNCSRSHLGVGVNGGVNLQSVSSSSMQLITTCTANNRQCPIRPAFMPRE